MNVETKFLEQYIIYGVGLKFRYTRLEELPYKDYDDFSRKKFNGWRKIGVGDCNEFD